VRLEGLGKLKNLIASPGIEPTGFRLIAYCLVNGTVVSLVTAKFKPFIFPGSGFTFSNVAKICIFMILYDPCLLPARFRYVIIRIRYLARHVHFADWCAPWKFASGAENHVLQAVRFQKVDICRKFPSGANISYYWSN
jgi:hypothetical protein